MQNGDMNKTKQGKKKHNGNNRLKTYETNNAEAQKNDPSFEYNSACSRSFYRDFWFGLNIFDIYKPEQITALVKDPIGNNKTLRDISRMLYGTNGTYTNTVDYMTAMPTLDNVIVPHGKNKNKRKINKELMESALRIIKHKEVIRDALWRGMVDGIAFYYFETTGALPLSRKTLNDHDIANLIEINDIKLNASVFPLPADYTEIVGRRNNSYVIAFNLDYFSAANGEDPETKVKKFPKEIRDAYERWRRQKTGGEGNWVILDNNKTIVHKIRSEIKEKYGRPLVLAAISAILYDDYFTDTKRNVLGDINNRVIYQTLPEGRDKGTCSLNQKQQKEQHEKVKGAVLNRSNRSGNSFVTVAAGTKLDALKIGDTDIFDSKYEEKLGDKIARALGFAGSALDGIGSGSYSAQQTNLELVTAQIFQWIDQISAELNKCISENIICDKNNWVECRYLPITYVNKKAMVGYAKELYLQGKGSLALWASACGVSSDIFFALLDQELEEGIEDKYPVHKTSYVLSKDDQKGGRPKTDDPSDKTIQSQANNGNAIPSPSDK